MTGTVRIIDRPLRSRLLAGVPILGGIVAGLLLVPSAVDTMRLEGMAGLPATMVTLLFALAARPHKWWDWTTLSAIAFLSVAAAILGALLLWLAGNGADLPEKKFLFAVPLAITAAFAGSILPWLVAWHLGRRVGLWNMPDPGAGLRGNR